MKISQPGQYSTVTHLMTILTSKNKHQQTLYICLQKNYHV